MTPLNNKTDPRITNVIRQLQDAGYEAYIVGGAVRDILLNRTPKDYDISTSATPEQVRAVFRKCRCIIIGRRFRLVHLYLQDDIVEISTFRKRPEQNEQFPRPERAKDAPEHMIFCDNEYGTAQEDAFRRDFTVNALFYDPVHDEVRDHTGQGLEDVQQGVVRCIGDPALRFEEDPVRMLRALKLLGQYQGFRLEEGTGNAIRECLPLIVHASVSRMTLEMEKILKNPYCSSILFTFRQYGFLRYFLPETDRIFGTPQGEYLQRLLQCRDERLREGKYRDSMSLVLGLFTIPFMEKRSGNAEGELWKPALDIEKQFNEVMHKMLYPHVLTRRSCISAIKKLLLQPLFRHQENVERCYSFFSYTGAREMAAIQNDVCWNLPGFEEAYPAHPDSSTFGFQPHRKRRHRGRRGGKRPVNPQDQNNGTGAAS